MRGFGRILAVVTALTLYGCLAPQNVEMVGVDVKAWSSTESIAYNNHDTLSLRNLNIAIRYNDDFKPTTLPLKIGVITPDVRYFEEVVALQLRHPNTALTVATTESLPYRNRVVLTQKGEYVFAFTPLAEVDGVEAIGIEIK